MGVKKHTSYTWESPDGETFPMPFEFSCEDSVLFKMSDDGLSAVLGVLDNDTDPIDPMEYGEEGELVIFDRSNSRPDVESWKRLIRENSGFIVPVDYGDYGASGSRISCGQVLTGKDTKGDKRTGENSPCESILDDMDGYYIIPNDVTNPQKYANGTMKTLEQYYNGDVYGVCVWTYTRDFAEYDLQGQGVPGEYTDWELVDRDECWGYYGYDYAKMELQEQFDATDFPKPEEKSNKQEVLPLCGLNATRGYL